MKKIYITPNIKCITTKTESLLSALSNGNVEQEAPDLGLDGGGRIEGAGNGDGQEAAKLHSTNVWEAWEEY